MTSSVAIPVTTERRLHPIIWFRREVISESTDLAYLWPYRVEVASSLDDFLGKFSEGELSRGMRYGWDEPVARYPARPESKGNASPEPQSRRSGIQVLKSGSREPRRAGKAGFPQ